MVVISVPGEYAADEAKKALNKGIHVMPFSDNVPIEKEIELKKLAHEKDYWLWGLTVALLLLMVFPMLCQCSK